MFRHLLTLLVLILALPMSAQVKVTGKVTDGMNSPLSGASVTVKGTTKGVSSDFDGNYEIEAKQGDVLEFSFIGFQTQTQKVMGGGKSLIINISLKEDAQELDDVVVIGYGTQKKANLTGTVNTVKAETIEGKATTSLTNALQGVAPGVTIISRPGDIGNDMGNINVRGRGSLGTAAPLYIVDGIPVSEGDFQRIYTGDIESISVLKDAAASAIYGARAAHGVFLVTTKKGKEGKASISYNGYYGFQSPTILPKKLNSYNYATLLNEANINAGKDAIYDQKAIDRIVAQDSPDLYPNNDWYSLVFRKHIPIQEHNINISGGGKTRYFVSGTFYEQESVVKGRLLDRYSFRANTERDFTDKFTLGTNISYVQDYFNRDGNFSITDLDRMTPLTVARHTDGSWGTVTGGNESTVLAENNPLRKAAEYGRKDYISTRFNGSINAIWKPIKGLNITGQLSYRTFDKRDTEFENKVGQLTGFISKKPMKGTDGQTINKMTKTWEHSKNLTSQVYANYDFSLNNHNFSLMGGTQYEDYRYEWLRASRKDFPNNNLNSINAGSAKAENLGNDGRIQERAFLSYFGRLKYNYDGKYLFEANVRADQSSQFPKENRLGVFPSFSAAYRISQENFMRNIEWLSDLKLRASWGKLGNVDNVGYYDYYDALGVGSAYITDGVKNDGVWPSIQVNKNLTWETVTMTNLGLDASFFKNSLNIQLDVFDKLTSDILLKMPQPYELGLLTNTNLDERAAKNAGKVSNKGIEALVSYRGSVGDFKYGISGNISKIWNKIIDLNGQDNQVNGNFILKEGEAIGSFYGYKALGLFRDSEDVKNHVKQDAATGAGDIKYADTDKNGKFDADDRTILGNDVPYFTYGLGFDVSYKGFDFSVQGQGVRDVLVYLSGEASQAFFNGAGAKEYHLGRWTTQNPDPNANYPRLLITSANNHNARTSSFWLYDADYFRIKSIILGYTMPQEVSQLIGFQKVRFYLSGTNLITFRADKRLKDFDPEAPSQRGTYPNMKNIIFGVNVSF
ncbi:SusC/RagA family TonB-linked outer membrane protein [Capnocytophaga cynodegmi]|uniref:SusC/RagA family TonB-linked outer membrane protein n=1 Tax=Capnocytophaga cynodegmi TaxID=28189 RepID=UPI001EE1B39A|nr:TonB-dependent receptor [Capnocytophaga cynodegmi]GJQ07048.1 SusC/RagA family TonB-linked outer membrane protein [Capnocytophaga cynodegmi]